ncbi:MAG: ABC transporter ATP-binding protein [Anaerolineales bacterium]
MNSAPRSDLRAYVNLLARYVRPYWRQATLLTVLLLGSIGLSLVSPRIIAGFIDQAKNQAALSQLTRAALTYLVIGLTVRFSDVAVAWLGTNLGFATTNKLREDLAQHLLSLDMEFHNSHTPGEMIERIDGDVTSLTNFFSQFAVRLVGALLLILGVVVMMFLADWRVGLVMGVFALGTLVIMVLMSRFAAQESEAQRQANAELFGFVEERLAGLDDIRASGAGPYTMRRLLEIGRSWYQRTVRAEKRRGYMWLFMSGFWGLSGVIALALGIVFYLQGKFSIGMVYMLFSYSQMLGDPIERISAQVQDLQKAIAAIGRVRDLFALQPTITHGHGTLLPVGALPLEFDDVVFHYDDGDADEPVLQHVSFALAPGTTLGLLGRTGSGKTTLTRLLFRLWDPKAGHVRLAGHALPEVNLEQLRQRVGMVTQEVQLFEASVRDNLTFFDESIPDERVIAVIRELGLGAWFDTLEKGLDTMLPPGGGGLSAGEQQLLAFGRVFLQDPGLVVLDEPSSRLDPATEQRLELAMDRLLEGRTGIIIAHRLATVQRVDEIMIMEQGTIQEHGRRADLVADPHSRFHQLLTTGLEEAFA